MPYPDSPFPDETLSRELIFELGQETSNKIWISDGEYKSLLKWLCSSPKISSYRVNTLKCSISEIIAKMKDYYQKNYCSDFVYVDKHPIIPDVIIIHNTNIPAPLKLYETEIIVDADCACAILRGSDIYAPGVLGMMSGTQIGDNVSIYADLSKRCKRGLPRPFEDENKLFIANGRAKMQRHELFGENLKPSGVAVELVESISGCPPLHERKILPEGCILLQNLPSILCVMALDPQPGETILDMCASPGNKTTHIGELMKNKGTLVAIDKTPKKVSVLEDKCRTFGVQSCTYVADSAKIGDKNTEKREDGPQFPPESFDRILLDAPCSALGKRPQLVNRLSEKQIKSYVPLQRKLFEAAVRLLKPGGTLVYSTCTITLAENEGIVAWALRNFQDLKLVRPQLSLGGAGWKGASLTDGELSCLQRFGPEEKIDSVGFFFACFKKRATC